LVDQKKKHASRRLRKRHSSNKKANLERFAPVHFEARFSTKELVPFGLLPSLSKIFLFLNLLLG
jgi:hypothetical protein